jgi:large subunit ribosomal protein L35Ae
MKGKVVQFRRGLKHVHERHFILDLGAKDKKDAEKLVGKDVSWKSPAGKVIKGKVSGSHGTRGLVRAIFDRGLPGQSINTEVEVK